jgi:hypothetical protein
MPHVRPDGVCGGEFSAAVRDLNEEDGEASKQVMERKARELRKAAAHMRLVVIDVGKTNSTTLGPRPLE